MEYPFGSLAEIKELLSHHPMFAAGILLVVGYLIGKLAARVRLPEITGYIVAGLLMGEAVTGVFPHHMGESFTVVTEIALGLIALTIGGEFYWVKVKRMGAGVIVVTITQLLMTFAVVALGLWLLRMPPPFALMLGAIASATAPAATVAIVQSLRAHGVFVDYLYGIVGLDDAGCVILFGLIFAFAAGFLKTSGASVSAVSLVGFAFMEVGLSILIGLISGVLLHTGTRRKNNTNEILIISIGIIFMATALAIALHLSPLLTNMATGATVINLSARNHRIFRIVEPLTPPIYALFFVIAGTELQPAIVQQREVLLFGLIYVLLRAAGKYGGVFWGASLGRLPRRTRRWLGLCMLPQAGVAIGLVLHVQASPITEGLSADMSHVVDSMVNIVLLSVFVNELVGPPLSRLAILRGNDMEEQ